MLKEIRCDKFIDHGVERPPIILHQGLNAVLGDNQGTNSIGKSTFLMVIDFIFGGIDYVNRCTDVQEEVKVHTIKFQFEFDGKPFYFSRSTGDTTVVNICDQDYNVVRTMSTDKYMEFLAEKYGLNLPGLTLRNAVSRFFRVYGRETLSEKHPLRDATQQSEAIGIQGMLKLFNLYSAVDEKSKITNAAKDELDTFRKAQQYKYIRAVSNQTEFKNNAAKMEELEAKAKELAAQSSDGLLDMDSIKAQRLAEFRRQLSSFKRQRTKLYGQLRSTEDDRDFSKHAFQKDYDALLQFFPEVDVARLEGLEAFHKNLKKVLDKEFKENAQSIRAMIDLTSTEIKALEEQIAALGKIPNVSQAILDQYSAVQKELQALREANDNYEKTSVLKAKYKELKDSLDALVVSVITQLQADLNARMQEINDVIYDGKKTPPTLTITDASHYNFFTPKDNGTGSLYKGLIVFDLAALERSNLPVIAHDSLLLKQIGRQPLEKILELYSESPKQVFIAFDMAEAYTERSQEILRDKAVLELSEGEGALYGRTWNQVEG